MPIKAFWTLNNQIDRIRAEEELQLNRAVAYAQGGEGTQEYLDGLRQTVGKTMVIDPVRGAQRDEAGFAELKSMAQQMIES